MQTLRPYQERALADLRVHWQDNPILVAPTGSGKTTVMAHLVAGAIAKGKRVLFLCHRKELVTQAAERFGCPVGFIKAGMDEDRSAPVQIATVQTLIRRKPPPADIVLIDEAHHAVADTYQSIIKKYPQACIIGATATPFRADGRGLREAGFNALVIAASPAELIAEGSLMEPVHYLSRETPDLSGVRTVAGDYHQQGLAFVMDRPKLIGNIVDDWKAHGADRPTVVFASSVEHSVHLAEAMGGRHLDCNSADRDEILEDFSAGRCSVITNYGILTEGWDVPAASVCVLARPTKCLGLYLQMVGRIMRPLPGKARPIILDNGGLGLRHGLVTEEIEYSLDSKVKRKIEMAVKNCERCFALIRSYPCPECGFMPEREERDGPDHVSGKMEVLTADGTRKAWYVERVKEAYSKRWKIGAARHKYFQKYGSWPRLYSVEIEHYPPMAVSKAAADEWAERNKSYWQRHSNTSPLAETSRHGASTSPRHATWEDDS